MRMIPERPWSTSASAQPKNFQRGVNQKMTGYGVSLRKGKAITCNNSLIRFLFTKRFWVAGPNGPEDLQPTYISKKTWARSVVWICWGWAKLQGLRTSAVNRTWSKTIGQNHFGAVPVWTQNASGTFRTWSWSHVSVIAMALSTPRESEAQGTASLALLAPCIPKKPPTHTNH